MSDTIANLCGLGGAIAFILVMIIRARPIDFLADAIDALRDAYIPCDEGEEWKRR